MLILGIETSCDETALALIETRGIRANIDGVDSKTGIDLKHGENFELRVISSLVHSQAELHSAYGGVYPSLAKREHGKNLVPLLEKLMSDSRDVLMEIGGFRENTNLKSIEDFKDEFVAQNPDLWESISKSNILKEIPPIGCIAVTEGPGLEPALWVGINFARLLSSTWSIPLIPVNHMEGHIIGSLIDENVPYGSWQRLKTIDFPVVALLISGGHTELVRIDDGFKYSILGQTKDDAVGEAYDKVARLLGLPYPGGPQIAKLANEARHAGASSEIKLPRPMIKSKDMDFSFSGLKTAVLYAVRAHSQADGSLDDDFKRSIAMEFEQAVSDTLEHKLRSAIEASGVKAIIVGGGVSANLYLQQTFKKVANEYGIPIFLPSKHISGDNALMIALSGAMHDVPVGIEIRAKGTKKLA